jgi:hypothetical protein
VYRFRNKRYILKVVMMQLYLAIGQQKNKEKV